MHGNKQMTDESLQVIIGSLYTAAYLWQVNLGNFPILILSANIHFLDASVSAYHK